MVDETALLRVDKISPFDVAAEMISLQRDSLRNYMKLRLVMSALDGVSMHPKFTQSGNHQPTWVNLPPLKPSSVGSLFADLQPPLDLKSLAALAVSHSGGHPRTLAVLHAFLKTSPRKSYTTYEALLAAMEISFKNHGLIPVTFDCSHLQHGLPLPELPGLGLRTLDRTLSLDPVLQQLSVNPPSIGHNVGTWRPVFSPIRLWYWARLSSLEPHSQLRSSIDVARSTLDESLRMDVQP